MSKLLPTLTFPLRAGAMACIALLGSSGALAQGERWYRVELLIFTNETAGAATAERWDATPTLAYPGAARFLVDPQRVEANLANVRQQQPGVIFENTLDEFGRQIIAPLPDGAADQTGAGFSIAPGPGSTATAPPTANTPRPMSPVYSEPAAPASAPVAAAVPVSEPQPEPQLLAPYTLLGSEQQEFRGKAAYMQRLGRYQTLFHESWIQPLEVEARSLPIVLDHSGDTGVWPRLQGSVKLYLSRYAHLETNLWLNTDGSYLPGQWSMPAPPLGPPSLVIEEPVFANEADSFGQPISVTDGAAAAERAGTAQGTAAADTGSAEASTDTGEELVAANILEPVYPYRHAVTLQQKRRMRSGEIHYIDHPMLGIVIKLTPLNPDDLPAPN